MAHVNDPLITELSNAVREFAISVEMPGTPCIKIHEDADAIIALVKRIACVHGGPYGA